MAAAEGDVTGEVRDRFAVHRRRRASFARVPLSTSFDRFLAIRIWHRSGSLVPCLHPDDSAVLTYPPRKIHVSHVTVCHSRTYHVSLTSRPSRTSWTV
jgi:hypothetical protein